MKRRETAAGEQLPDELVRFDGHRYRTAAAWRAAFDQFHGGRRQWARQHGLDVDDLPLWEVIGECPFDASTI